MNLTDQKIFPNISVVITTKNEEKHIRACLSSIANQTYPRGQIEIIVVDNQSSDLTKEIAKGFTSLVFDKGPERNAQRNYGMIDIAKGEYLMWIDADMILSPNLIEECVRSMGNSEDIALFIPEIVLGRDFWSRVRRFERSFYDNTVIDGSRFIKGDVFVKSGGFSREWMHGPDDWDLDKKLKKFGPIGYLSNTSPSQEWGNESEHIRKRGIEPENHGAVIYHDESEFRVGRYLRKKQHYITDFQKYITRWGANDPDLKKQLGLWYRYFGVFIENGKWKKIIAHPVLYFSALVLRAMVGVTYILNKGRG
jgi:glycosyltransferase involved in cell wall biosynthesis